ncbi:MAG: tetratricopeptide repeat protein [Rhodomicrobium sp.]
MNRKQRRAAAKSGQATSIPLREAATEPTAPQATELLEAGRKLHQAGRLAEAEACYRRALTAHPGNADAYHLLGIVAGQTGRAGLSAELIGQAIKLNKRNAFYFSNLGNALHALKRLDEALASYGKAIALQPDFTEALYNRANVLAELKRFGEALASYDKTLELQPGFAEAFNNRGNTLHALKRFDEAVASYGKALALRPDFPNALYNLGNALAELKRLGEALASYNDALALYPGYAEALNNRGLALRGLRQPGAALDSFNKALALKPDFADAFSNRGLALRELWQLDAALASCDKALALEPGHAEAFYNRGTVLQELNRLEEALACYEKALALQPDHAYAFSGVIRCVNSLCDWERRTALASELTAHITEQKSIISPFTVLGWTGDPLLQLQCARNFTASTLPPPLAPFWTGEKWRNEKIRIAYLSADFREHATAHLMAELFELHDRSQFEIVAVSSGIDDGSAMRNRLAAAFDRFIDIREKSDEEAAKLLYGLEASIAIDLKGHTQDSRPGILAYRPAPVQASYLGYPGTMGASFIDYIIADETVAPFGHQAFYTEKIVHLPDCYQANDSKRSIAQRTPTRREAGLPEEGFVFCCFNQSWKITPEVFDVWMRLLHAAAGSVLWLIHDDAGTERNLRNEAQARGIGPARLVFAGRLPLEEHLARHRLADLFLDTLPYNAHTTASDALWAGVPVLTRAGEAFAGRVAASLLNAIGLPELVTHSLAEYEALALRLAREPVLLEGYRNRLCTNRLTHPLFDTGRFRRHLEAAYLQMWEIWQRGEQPRSFKVEAEGVCIPRSSL